METKGSSPNVALIIKQIKDNFSTSISPEIFTKPDGIR